MNMEVQLKARCVGLREQMEEEKRLEVQEACRRLREEMRREAKMEKEKEMRVIQELTEVMSTRNAYLMLPLSSHFRFYLS